ncbi:MAG: hypothetical protein WC758_08025 [Candidatus Woesearchaeota archaeon]
MVFQPKKKIREEVEEYEEELEEEEEEEEPQVEIPKRKLVPQVQKQVKNEEPSIKEIISNIEMLYGVMQKNEDRIIRLESAFFRATQR